MNKDLDGCFALLGRWIVVISGALVYVVAALIVKGYVLASLWEWFVVPTFALPSLSVPLAIGLTTTVFIAMPKQIVKTPAQEKKRSTSEKWLDAAMFVFGPLLSLPLAQIILWFMAR